MNKKQFSDPRRLAQNMIAKEINGLSHQGGEHPALINIWSTVSPNLTKEKYTKSPLNEQLLKKVKLYQEGRKRKRINTENLEGIQIKKVNHLDNFL